MLNKVSCPQCGYESNSQNKLFSNMTCERCKNRFSFAFNIYTRNYQVYDTHSSTNTTTNVRRFLYIVERGRCHYCKKSVKFDDTTIDHMLPVSKDGGNFLHNMVLSCRSCNGAKANLDYDTFTNNWYYLPNKQTRKQEKRNRKWLTKLIGWYTTACVLLTKLTLR